MKNKGKQKKLFVKKENDTFLKFFNFLHTNGTFLWYAHKWHNFRNWIFDIFSKITTILESNRRPITHSVLSYKNSIYPRIPRILNQIQTPGNKHRFILYFSVQQTHGKHHAYEKPVFLFQVTCLQLSPQVYGKVIFSNLCFFLLLKLIFLQTFFRY